jgi:TrmH family RNA methyltransferase
MSQPLRIISPQNARLKKVAKLRDRRPRKQLGLFLIDGARQIGRAIAAGISVTELYFAEPSELSAGELPASELAVIEQARSAGAEIIPVAKALFGKIAYGDRQLGLVAVAQTPSFELTQLKLPPDAFVMVIEQLEKPGNLGAILRTADAAGCQALVVADAVTDLTNPNVIRASMGAVFTVPVAQADSPTVRQWLVEQGFQAYAARVDGAVDYTSVDYRGRVALVLGSEANGLSDLWQGPATQAIRLPMQGVVDSLNVSVTAAVLLYEAHRQRRG